MLDLITHFGDSSSGIGALGINAGSFLIQLITFIIALLVLKRWAFKPILKILNDRRATIEKGVELGQQMQREKEALDAKVAETLAKARQDADKIVSEAHATGRETIAAAEEAARKKAEGILASNEEQIQQDVARARKALEKELVGLVSNVTEVLIHEKVDTKKDAKLIEDALERGVKT